MKLPIINSLHIYIQR